MLSESSIARGYDAAVERFAAVGVDVPAALRTLAGVAVSIHCWQGDDVAGFENPDGVPGGGLAVTGSWPGRARCGDELRADLDVALGLIPGRHRLNLHACYAEPAGGPVDRDRLEPGHFSRWIDWAKPRLAGLDFNPTFFAHPLAADGWTLAHADDSIRDYWVRHGQACRRIAAAMGRALGSPSVCNVWIPDGMKDTPVDRLGPRQRLLQALDAVCAESFPATELLDAVECKLFGLGSESYTAGSHEFYLGYAAARRKLLCLDAGHFHPTESIGDKISAVLLWVPRLLLHVSRGLRWDSDHVVTTTDDLLFIAQEVVRGGFLERVHFGLDYFDASINRVAAWVIGTRALLKAVLAALLEPAATLRHLEASGDYTGRLALLEETRALPVGPVWDRYCLEQGVPAGSDWLEAVREHERRVLPHRRPGRSAGASG